jgi:hypothetical protein
MEYQGVVIIHRKEKQIVFFLKTGYAMDTDNIVDVEVYDEAMPAMQDREIRYGILPEGRGLQDL